MIHPTAIIHPGAKIAKVVNIGPYTVVGEHVSIGVGTTVAGHVVIEGWTEIGCGNRIFQFSGFSHDKIRPVPVNASVFLITI